MINHLIPLDTSESGTLGPDKEERGFYLPCVDVDLNPMSVTSDDSDTDTPVVPIVG